MSPARFPRHLEHRHWARLVRLRDGNNKDGDDGSAASTLQPGQEQLVSYYLPGLQAGRHQIDVKQTIDLVKTLVPRDEHDATLESTQTFEVVGPRFSLPQDAIHSVYPPQGHHDQAEILPHVVFNDATFPWLRSGAPREEDQTPPPEDYGENRAPWLAVLSFTAQELQRSPDELKEIFHDVQQEGVVQSSTWTVTVPVTDIGKLRQTVSPIPCKQQESTENSEKTEIVLLPAALFTGLFSKYDEYGHRIANDKNDSNEEYPAVYHHRLLAHRRDIYSEGMAKAASQSDGYGRSYGVIYGNRGGPRAITRPTPVYVHLVSLEGIEGLKPWPLNAASTRYVALSSLMSWSYVCLPPNTPDVRQQLLNLGTNTHTLRPQLTPDEVSELKKNGHVGQRVLDRLENGFSMARYRCLTGESTVAFTRGPFVPIADPKALLPPSPPELGWASPSMTGSDLQILDVELGIMDLTYSAAWQLGRTLALADTAFTAALFRVRCQILARAMDAAAQGLCKTGQYRSREALLRSLAARVSQLTFLAQGSQQEQQQQQQRPGRHRWCRTPAKRLELRYNSSDVQESLVDAAKDIASTPDAADPSKPSRTPYDEYNTPFSTDWVIVLRWILDRYTFASIPAHYLVTDASHLPLESIRFFAVDNIWMECLLDGALSLGNHIDHEHDEVRAAIEAAVRWFRESPNSHHEFPHQLPRYGCFLRSQLVAKFPDLIVGVEPAPELDQPPVLLTHTLLDETTMLCLFSEMPSETSGRFHTLTLTQPPHQQMFTMGSRTPGIDRLKTTYNRAYTVPPDDPDVRTPLRDVEWPDPTTGRTVYVEADENGVSLRLFLIEPLAKDYLSCLRLDMPKQFQNTRVTSSLMGFQNTARSFQLRVRPSFTPPPSDNDKCNDSRRQKDEQVQSRARARALPRQKRPSTSSYIPDSSTQKDSSSTGSVPETVSSSVESTSTYYPHVHLARSWRVVPDLSSSSSSSSSSSDHTMTETNPARSVDRIHAPPESGPATYPQYEYNFWSADYPGTPSNPGTIPISKTKVPQDLIVSIRLTSPPYDYQLCKIEVRLPLGKATAPDPGLMEAYQGSGAEMLSNLRFVLHIGYDTKSSQLVLGLFPRSQSGAVRVSRCVDLSFMLAGVVVNEFDKGVALPVDVQEYYLHEPVQKPFRLPSLRLTPGAS